MTPQPITVTDNAAKRVLALLSKTPGAALRVKIISGGCSGMEYKLEPDTNPPKPGDTVVETKGIKVYLDAKGLLYMIGTELDYVSSLMSSGFKFRNPQAQAECSCGQSFTV